ncbi:MAG: sulfite exporter TauE/SafE family protein [Planctomycetota bacterium]|nr:sulfite exporter TauE/SafE family protein [Planctomycetota bacterium]
MDWLAMLFGALIGTTVGITGVGGGVLIFPTLTAVFGLSSTQAIATSFVFAFASRFGASISHYKIGNIKVKLGAVIGLGGLAPVLLMSYIFDQYEKSDSIQFGIRIAFFCVVMLCLASMVFKKKKDPEDEESETEQQADSGLEEPDRVPVPKAVGAGLLTGTVIGVTSVGGGVLIIPLLMRFFDLDIRKAVGTGIWTSLIIALAGVLFMQSSVEWALVISLLCGSIPAVLVGGILSKKIPAKIVRGLVIVLMLVACVAVFVK